MTVTVYKKIWEDGAKEEKAPYSPHMELCDDGDVACYHNVKLIDGSSNDFRLGFVESGGIVGLRFSLQYWTISTVTEF